MGVGRPREFDMAQALDAAMQVFWRRGYEGASITELTQAMGIASPSLYAAFGNKEGLFKAVLDHYAARRAECLDEVMSAPTARETAERLLYGLIDLVTDPEEPPGCLLLQGGLSCGAATPGIPQELARRRADLEQALEKRFTWARNSGDLPKDTDPAALARYLAALCNGLAIEAAAGAKREALRQIADVALRTFAENATV
jgi:AcrR family transcriptional regulator